MICIMFPNQEGAGGTGASHINPLLTLTVDDAHDFQGRQLSEALSYASLLI